VQQYGCELLDPALRQRQAEVHEGVKLDAAVLALRADECGLVQALEVIHNVAVIAQPVVGPGCRGQLLIRHTLRVRLLHDTQPTASTAGAQNLLDAQAMCGWLSRQGAAGATCWCQQHCLRSHEATASRPVTIQLASTSVACVHDGLPKSRLHRKQSDNFIKQTHVCMRAFACIAACCVAVPDLNVGLLLYPVDVLVQAIQQEAKELLAVMLLVAAELRCKLSNLGLECPRHHTANARLQDTDSTTGRAMNTTKPGCLAWRLASPVETLEHTTPAQ